MKEVMRQDLLHGWPFPWVCLQDAAHQGFALVRYDHVFREALGVGPDFAVGGLDVVCLEGRLTHQERLDDHAERPGVHLVRVPVLALQDFRRDVVGRAADGPLAFSVELQLGGQSEIPYFDLHVVTQEKVTQLQVAVDDPVAVQLPKGRNYLDDVALHLQLCQSLPPPKQVVDGLVSTQLQEDLDLLSIFKEMLKLNYVVVVQRSVYLDLTHQLLLSSALD